ncbi:MAG: gliding motility lipoprotein GldH [Flavobacterium sp.]|nr:gliding motility lipoprotein GldH [Flavobacterium sp.]
MKVKFILFSVLLICFSCDSSLLYNEFDSNFDDNRWYADASKEFDFSIKKDEEASIVLHLGHVYDSQFASIPLLISILNPKKESEVMLIDLEIKDKNGKDIGECSGDICDLFFTIKEKNLAEKRKL